MRIINFRRSYLFFALIAFVAFVSFRWFSQSEQVIIWTAIHVSGMNQSGDAHLLQMPDGRNILIDTGFAHYARSDLLPELQKKGITHIDSVLVTHPHRNHYGSIGHLVQQLKVEKVFFNKPNADLCGKEKWATGCNVKHVEAIRQEAEKYSRLLPAEEGQIIYRDPKRDIELKVLHYFSSPNDKRLLSANLQTKKMSVNDASVVSFLRYGKVSVLFPGDIGQLTGEYLSKYRSQSINATVLSAPHHGIAAITPDDFFDKVDPETVIVSVSAPVWFSDRGIQLRSYTEKNQIPTYVTGVNGNIQVSLTPTGYSIETAK